MHEEEPKNEPHAYYGRFGKKTYIPKKDENKIIKEENVISKKDDNFSYTYTRKFYRKFNYNNNDNNNEKDENNNNKLIENNVNSRKKIFEKYIFKSQKTNENEIEGRRVHKTLNTNKSSNFISRGTYMRKNINEDISIDIDDNKNNIINKRYIYNKKNNYHKEDEDQKKKNLILSPTSEKGSAYMSLKKRFFFYKRKRRRT